MKLGDINPGMLNQPVALEEATATADSTGRKVKTWAEVASNLYASIEQVGGGETAFGGGTKTRLDYAIVTRADPRVKQDATQRLVWRGRRLNVSRVIDVETKGLYFWILATEETTGAL